MSIITLPESLPIPTNIEWSYRPNVAEHQSPLNRSMQRQIRPGGIYTMNASWEVLDLDEWADLEACLEQLAGAWVRLPHWAYSQRGSLSGAPVVDGGGQTGKTLETSGWSANASEVLKAGDFIELPGHALCRVASTVDADAEGDATIALTRPLPTIPDDQAAIEITEPRALFVLDEGEQWTGAHTAPQFGAYSLAFRQDITAGAGS